MAGIEEDEDRVGKFPEQGRVKNVRNQWMVYEDGVLASQMQDEEFETKYGLNRFHRRTVRDDIPVAKVVQSEEEERKQREELTRLERQKMISDEDERIALEIQERLKLEADNERLQGQLADEERVRRLLENEQESVMQDEEFARQLQEKEKEKFEKKRLERERRKLENQIANERLEAEKVLSQYRKESQPASRDNARNVTRETMQTSGAHPDQLLRVDGKVEDTGDFSDFYSLPDDMHEVDRMKMQELQDEELARLLQEQEQKRGGQVKQDNLKAIEKQDEELARIMQEQEKLRERKRKQRREERKASERNSLQRQEGEPRAGERNSLHRQHGETRDVPQHLSHRQHSLPTETRDSRERFNSQQSVESDPEYQNIGNFMALNNGNRHPSLDPRDEELYEQPWNSIPHMAPPPPPPPPPSNHPSLQRPPQDRLGTIDDNIFQNQELRENQRHGQALETSRESFNDTLHNTYDNHINEL